MPRRSNRRDEDSSSSSSSSSSSRHRRSRGNRRATVEGSTCGNDALYRLIQIYNGSNNEVECGEKRTENGVAYVKHRAETDKHNDLFGLDVEGGVHLLSNEEGSNEFLKANVNAGFKGIMNGPVGISTGIGADVAAMSFQGEDSNLDLVKGRVGGEFGVGMGGVKVKGEAGFDVIAVEKELGYQKINVNLGLNADTGAEIGLAGVEVSFLGTGFSVGRKMGISTPFGGISLDLW